MTHPVVSVIMPVYNVERYVAQAIRSVLDQTFTQFELLIIDDGGQDGSVEICQGFRDPRIQIISQKNRGLAGARNSGIRHARGAYLAFLDSDDAWWPDKLAAHVDHLDNNPMVGVSYAGSRLIDDDGKPMNIYQQPKLKHISAYDVFMRNPVGNGSAPVIRRGVFRDIQGPYGLEGETAWFDEHFRQSEDIECWMRIALGTQWRFEGVPGIYTDYRINAGGLSANVINQFETWRRMRDRIARLDPEFAARWSRLAEAFQLRYLARRAFNARDRGLAIALMTRALKTHPGILVREPLKTLFSLAGTLLLRVLSEPQFDQVFALAKTLRGSRHPA